MIKCIRVKREKGRIQMSNKLFSQNEIEMLERNPNVLRVTRRIIQYTDEFKIRALSEYDNGKSERKIFEENGLPIEIIGMTRIYGFFKRIVMPYKPKERSSEPKSSQIKQLERKIIYLQQENEFLKKIQDLEKKQ